MASSECADAPNSWCRVCLAIDVKMHWIRSSRLLDVFEKLSTTKLNTEDGRPHTICYICYSHLQRCCKFSDMCHKSEQIQRERLQQSTEAEEAVPPSAITLNLSVTALPFMSIIDFSNQGNTQVKEELLIKQELIDKEESTLIEVVTVDHNIISLEQPPVKVKTETNNVCVLSFCCDVCNKTFAMKRKLAQHMLIHFSKEKHACNMCNKTFTYGSSLIKHKRIHIGEKPYACNMCNKSFTQGSSLTEHKRIHTGEKPYSCNICNKSLTQGNSLIEHKRIHTGEKSYACNVCNKSFASGSNLKIKKIKGHLFTHLIIHKRIHTGEKPYACNICSKSFASGGHLIIHKRIHTGEKPYACNICNKTYANSGNLIRHKRIHIGKKQYSCNISMQ